MARTIFYLCAVPRSMWEPKNPGGIGSLARDALSSELRISREVNLDKERSRYSLYCRRMEEAISPLLSSGEDEQGFEEALSSGMIPYTTIGQGYLDLLERENGSVGRLGASFFPPDEVELHMTSFIRAAEEMGMAGERFVRKRIHFLRMARKHGCGVIEIQDPFHLGSQEPAQTIFVKGKVEESPGLSSIDLSRPISQIDLEGFKGKRKQALFKKLISDIRRAIPNGAVNLSNPTNDLIAEALHEFVYQDEVDKPVNIRIIYRDASESAKPFPLFCLPKRPESEISHLLQLPPLRIGLMSMRHPRMDRDVDMAWFRNSRVSRSRSLAESEGYCHSRTLEQLKVAPVEDGLLIYLYHTGFEAAVVGFYHGLVEFLLERRELPPKLAVIPHYYRGPNSYEKSSRIWC